MESDEDLDAYNPDQPLQERRRIQRGIRDVEKDMHENVEDYLQPDSLKILETLDQLNDHAKKIKQTNEAAIDSKALLHLSDLQHRKLQRLTAGNLGNGVDPDEFVSKCITYMRQGRGIQNDEDDELTHTQRNRRRPARGAIGSDDDDDDDEETGDMGDMLDWSHFGRYACVPNIQRPALPGFLLGPLSVQKKVRKVTVRTARLQVRDLQEVRPEVLKTEDLARNEKNDLTAICKKILRQLRHVQESGQARLQEVYDDNNTDQDDLERAMEETGIAASGNIDLVRFCINPKSFGQTVENMFYVSFLIREGEIGVQYEENGLPSLYPAESSEVQGSVKSRHGMMRRQAVLSIDMKTWRELIDTYNIKEPMIEHRKEPNHQGPGARGWYS